MLALMSYFILLMVEGVDFTVVRWIWAWALQCIHIIHVDGLLFMILPLH